MIANERYMDSTNEKDSDNNQNVNNEIIYYAVYIPQENDKNSPVRHVYFDKTKALQAAKRQNGRFKAFTKRSNAEQFALYGNERSVPPSPVQTGMNAEEKLNNFKAPTPQNLVAFRKLVESGNIEEIKRTIWENPRYIISNCDAPTILQEGSRYNVMHISVRSPDPASVCELILNTITDKKFLQLIYGEQSDKTYEEYTDLLLDRFINTPDKGVNETPLHFASKFGCKAMVQVLVSYKQCVKTVTNKHGQTPKALICTRKNQNDKIKAEINNLLEEQYYVPVLRCEGNALQPMIGQPFTPSNPPKLNEDPLSPPVEVRAFAGPMTKEKAEEFRKKWKTPPRRQTMLSPKFHESQSLDSSFSTVHSPVLNLASRLQDTEKGLERVGRDLAEECNVCWKEYWPFLNDFADLRNKDDLIKFENYLKSKMVCPPIFCYEDKNKNTENTKNDVKNSTLDEINNLCEKFQATNLFDGDDDEDSECEFYTPPTSPMISSDDSSDEDDMCMAEEGKSTFIEGDQATKLDHAVYNAIPHEIDPDEFPYIYYWKHEMELLFQQNYRFIGKTPARMRILPDKPIARQFSLKPTKIDFNTD